MRKSRRKPFIAIGAGVILLAILFFVLTGNGLWEGKEGSTNSVIEKKKVVFLTKSMDSSFWQSAYAGAGAASAEYNLDLVCEGPDGDGEEDYEAQNEMIDRAIREQVDALLFSAIDFEKNAEAIDRAAKAGIRIVVVDSPVNSEAVECYIGTDNYEAGCMAGEEVLGNPAENLNIGIVNFDKSTENGQLREKGFRDTVLNDDRANITASINVKSTITDAREGTERMLLDNPQINVIVTFNEWTTLGVGDAVRVTVMVEAVIRNHQTLISQYSTIPILILISHLSVQHSMQNLTRWVLNIRTMMETATRQHRTNRLIQRSRQVLQH